MVGGFEPRARVSAGALPPDGSERGLDVNVGHPLPPLVGVPDLEGSGARIDLLESQPVLVRCRIETILLVRGEDPSTVSACAHSSTGAGRARKYP